MTVQARVRPLAERAPEPARGASGGRTSPPPRCEPVSQWSQGVGEQLRELAGLLDQQRTDLEEEFELGRHELDVLLALHRGRAPYSALQATLWADLDLTQRQVTHFINALTQRGWVKRVVGAEDRRLRLVQLTTSGVLFSARLTKERSARELGLFGQIPEPARGAVETARRLLVSTSHTEPLVVRRKCT